MDNLGRYFSTFQSCMDHRVFIDWVGTRDYLRTHISVISRSYSRGKPTSDSGPDPASLKIIRGYRKDAIETRCKGFETCFATWSIHVEREKKIYIYIFTFYIYIDLCYLHTYTDIYIHTYIHTYIPTCIHTNLHTCS